MSTDGHLTETSFGGVVVHDGRVLVITPTGRRVIGLPKGGLEPGESPEEAAAREVREEVAGVTLDPKGFTVFDVISAPDRTLLLFVLAGGVNSADLPAFRASSETSEMAVITAPQELAFPLHTVAVRAWFEGRY